MWRIIMYDSDAELEEPFDWSTVDPGERVEFDDDEVPFDPFTPRWTS